MSGCQPTCEQRTVDAANCDLPNSAGCECDAGFIYTASRCIPVADCDICTNTNCSNGGECYSVDGKPVCDCPPNFSGDLCEIVGDPCDPNPCQNGGTCSKNELGEANCACTNSFAGPLCKFGIDATATTPKSSPTTPPTPAPTPAPTPPPSTCNVKVGGKNMTRGSWKHVNSLVVLLDYKIPCDSSIIRWNYYSTGNGRDVNGAVFRKTGSHTFKLIGFQVLSGAKTGKVSVDVPVDQRIAVKKGDFLGIFTTVNNSKVLTCDLSVDVKPPGFTTYEYIRYKNYATQYDLVAGTEFKTKTKTRKYRRYALNVDLE
ncbi:uncharacterized protein LOC141910943 [Tubulanus polymorphus]|uniref:uncharacterized protein LOC141910943 n=1 Tax=Tubulanus polymorphus TaxID=672921 RepID=UPI003DA35D20